MKRNSRGEADVMVIFGGFTILFFVALLVFSLVNALHTESRTCVVEDKESVAKSEGHEYRVYTQDCGTLVVADSWFSRTWHASDTYRSLEGGKTYDMTLRGHRVPFFSMFPNVVEAEVVE